ncbi:MAG: hypothetical protein ISS01_00740 [Nanoarchaeota archaeon]|nr:hypothetical protein [Nanoarchaeota archaeon]
MKRLLPLALTACMHTGPNPIKVGSSTYILLNQTQDLTFQLDRKTTAYIRRGDSWRQEGGYYDQWNNRILSPTSNLGFTFYLSDQSLTLISNAANCTERYEIYLVEKENSSYTLEKECTNLHNALTSNEGLTFEEIDPEDLTFIKARIDDLLNIEIEKTSWNR